MSTMTLEQVRDWHREQQQGVAGFSTHRAMADAIDAHLAAREAEAVPVAVKAAPKLIGWRMADYTAETSDPDKAKNWSANVPVLPIFEGDPNTKLYASPVAKEAAAPAEQAVGDGVEWRCFHCDESFSDRAQAMLHFGESERQTPACQIDITEYRAMETRMERYNEEDADVHRAMARMQTAHATALRRAEEDGYAKALKDTGYTDAPRPAVAAPAEVIVSWRPIMERALRALERGANDTLDGRDAADEMRAALAAHPHTGYSAVPDEWKLVPRTMTARMVNAWSRGDVFSSDEKAARSHFQESWTRLLTAAPEARYISAGHCASDEAHRSANLLEKLSRKASGCDRHVIEVAVSYIRQHAATLAAAPEVTKP